MKTNLLGPTSMWITTAAFLLCVYLAGAQKSMLVLVENEKSARDYSELLAQLKEISPSVVVETTEKGASLRTFGEWNYDRLVLLAPSFKLDRSIKKADIKDFVDSGRDLFVAVSPSLSSQLRDLIYDFDIAVDSAQSLVLDHRHHNVSDESPHSLIITNFTSSGDAFGKSVNNILFRGIGLFAPKSPLTTRLLVGSSFSYSADPTKPVEDLFVAGKETTLVAAVQARNSARVVVSGSTELFGDEFMKGEVQRVGGKLEPSKNKAFAADLLRWAFHERGRIRIDRFVHYKVKGSVDPVGEPFQYTINDTIGIQADVSEFKDGKWQPFTMDKIYFDLSLINPYIRSPLHQLPNGTFSAESILPDHFGVYTLRIHHSVPGYDVFDSLYRLPVRPFRLSQKPRFLFHAYPYYIGSLLSMIAFAVFVAMFLFTKESERAKPTRARSDEKKTQ